MFRRLTQGTTVVLVVGLLALLVWDVAHQSAGKIASEVDQGKVVADWPFTRPLVNGSGTLSLASFHGKVVVLNFWESYCGPCTVEAKTLAAASKVWQAKNKNVVFLGVDFQDMRGPALRFLHRFGITYPNVSDQGPLVGHYGVTGFPETFFIDRNGQVVPPHIVGGATEQTLAEGIHRALST
jgi:cytochrome c biogenesis protein CcmG, thiol:disulfide interchange protein DsbE